MGFEALDVKFDYEQALSHADTDDHIAKDCTRYVTMAKKTGDATSNTLSYVEADSFGKNHALTTKRLLTKDHGYLRVRVTMDNEGTERYFSHWQRYLAGWHRVTYVRRHCSAAAAAAPAAAAVPAATTPTP